MSDASKIRKSKYLHYIEEDDNYNRWLNERYQTSVNTYRNYFTRMGYICNLTRQTPAQIAERAKAAKKSGDDTELRNWMQDLRDRLQNDTKLGRDGKVAEGKRRSKHILGYFDALISWLSYNVGSKFVPDIEINTREGSGLYDEEIPPSPEEMNRVLDVSDARTKVIISSIAFLGHMPWLDKTSRVIR